MKALEKVQILRDLIYNQLVPLIEGDFVYLDLPYHENLGDTLIWEGTEEFINNLPHKCLYRCGADYCDFSKIKNSSIILLHGGGNFGDIWVKHNNFRKKIIENFPGNKIIILPQTIHYDKEDNLNADIEFFSKHPNVIICARDNKSYDIAVRSFTKNKILMVPDMAFCMDMSRYKRKEEKDESVFIKRKDVEIANDIDYSIVPKGAVMEDWPTIEQIKLPYKTRIRLLRVMGKIDHVLKLNLSPKVNDWMYQKVIRPYNVQLAIDFLTKYNGVYTTRMHAAILCALLGKTVTLFDNSYGKSSSFYDSWMKDMDEVICLR